MILIHERNWSVIKESIPSELSEEWKRRENLRIAISLSIENNQIIHTCKSRNSKEIWVELQKVHERYNVSNTFIY